MTFLDQRPATPTDRRPHRLPSAGPSTEGTPPPPADPECLPDVTVAWSSIPAPARSTRRALVMELACIEDALREPAATRPSPWSLPDGTLRRRAVEISRLLRSDDPR